MKLQFLGPLYAHLISVLLLLLLLFIEMILSSTAFSLAFNNISAKTMNNGQGVVYCKLQELKMKLQTILLLTYICYFPVKSDEWEHVFSVSTTQELLHHLSKQQLNDSTLINIASGTYTPSELISLQDYSGIALMGPKESSPAIIDCNGEGGVSFTQCDGITIQNVTFSNCTNSDTASLSFSLCTDITISSVIIQNSPGYALVLYNTAGTNVLEYSRFSNNGQYPSPSLSGGGIAINIGCSIADCTSNTSMEYDSNSVYIINSNVFEYNIASPGLNLYTRSTKRGVGGAISCTFNGQSTNNSIEMNNNNISNNIAQYGGGLFVAFYDESHQNQLSSYNDSFTYNSALLPELTSYAGPIPLAAGGGGAAVVFGSANNEVYFHSNFLNNFASSNGGGLSISSMTNSTNYLTFEKVNVKYNTARLGAGTYFNHEFPSYRTSLLQVNLSSCNWFRNSIDGSCRLRLSSAPCSGIVYTNMISLTFTGDSTTFRENSGSPLHVHQATVTILSLTTTIIGNEADYGGALHLSDCGKMVVTHDINLFLSGNRAKFLGGAIYETGCLLNQCFVQYLEDSTVHPEHWNTHFFLNDNFAGNEFNAIYTDSLMSCTFDHINETFCWKSWKYDTASLCHSMIQTGPVYLNITRGLPADGEFDYTTVPGEPFHIYLKAYNAYGEEQTEEIRVCFYSGFGTLHRYFSTTDCFNRLTSDAIEVTLFAESTEISCDSYSGQHGTISLTTVRPPHLMLLATVGFNQCPDACSFNCPECYLRLANSTGIRCVQSDTCEITQYPCTLNSSLTTTPGYCWNLIDTKQGLSSLIGGLCPFTYSSVQPCVPISNFSTNTNASLLCPENREGRLCGKCASGYGVSMNTIDYKCIECNSKDWIIGLASELMIITMLIILLVVFSISLNAGGTNAFLFFAQVVTLKYPGLSYPSWVFEPEPVNINQYNDSVVKGFTLLYSISNLDAITPLPLAPFCISEQFKPLLVIVFDFIPALYPLMILGILYICIVLYSYRFKPVYIPAVAISKLRCFSRINCKPSLLDSFATITVLLFSRLTATCIKLFNPTFYYSALSGEWLGTAFYYDPTVDYFGSGHIYYVIVASVILVVCILLPATLLTFSSCIIRCLSRRYHINMPRIVALAKSFNESFKDGSEGTVDLRFIAGIYLYLRIVIRLLYLLHETKLILVFEMLISILVAVGFAVVRPYKYDNHNNIDALIFLYLALMAGISASGYAFVCYKGLLYLPLVIICVYGAYHFIHYLYSKVMELDRKHHQYRLLPVNDNEGSDEDSDEEVQDDQIRTAINIAQSNDPHNTEDMFADRLLNPDRYT